MVNSNEVSMTKSGLSLEHNIGKESLSKNIQTFRDSERLNRLA